jgi:hypothetical protein
MVDMNALDDFGKKKINQNQKKDNDFRNLIEIKNQEEEVEAEVVSDSTLNTVAVESNVSNSIEVATSLENKKERKQKVKITVSNEKPMLTVSFGLNREEFMLANSHLANHMEKTGKRTTITNIVKELYLKNIRKS